MVIVLLSDLNNAVSWPADVAAGVGCRILSAASRNNELKYKVITFAFFTFLFYSDLFLFLL